MDESKPFSHAVKDKRRHPILNKHALENLVKKASIGRQYDKQLERVKANGSQTDCIEQAVDGVIRNMPAEKSGSLVIYGDPQSGKTEMMICLTAKLLDNGEKTIIHLMNDSVDLLMQNLDRFKLAGLAPAPRNASDLINAPLIHGHAAILFCKKNAKDLAKLIQYTQNAGSLVIIDDEADYATPNAKINTQEKTKINGLVSDLLGAEGKYIGVTATPARLNLNNTFNNTPETWVHFPPHDAYTGPNHFFPLNETPKYRLTLLSGAGTTANAQKALARFLVTVAYLNATSVAENRIEQNYTFLVHTSGKTAVHRADREGIETAMLGLVSKAGASFEAFLDIINQQTQELYPNADAEVLIKYILANASRNAFVVLNSTRDRASAGDKPTEPTCPFTVIIGGNIVSRGVTFPNLLSMFFTRDVKSKIQQDTYIQRARMFGARGRYLEHFELTIPESLYSDWHRCFAFHRLALQAIKDNKISPVWVGDSRIAIAASTSIDRGTVNLNKGEMSFQIFDCTDPTKLDKIVAADPKNPQTLSLLAEAIGTALPQFLIKYIGSALTTAPGSLAIHKSSSIANYGTSADKETISRPKGLFGKPQLEQAKFPRAVHHVKIFHNGNGKARVFYKNVGNVHFVQNTKVR